MPSTSRSANGRRHATVATFAVVYHVGSRNEAVGYTGSTHLLEHLMFKGTPEFDRARGTAVAVIDHRPVALIEAGSFFGDMALFGVRPYRATVTSATQLKIGKKYSLVVSGLRGRCRSKIVGSM